MSIKDFNKPTINGKYTQGYFKPKNPIKYISNDKRIIYRSSLEQKFCILCDENPKVLEWGSEIIRIPYEMYVYNPKSGKIEMKRLGYWPDYVIKVQTDSGKKRKYLIEVKAAAFLQKPTKPTKNATRKKKISYIKKQKIYVQNKAKFLAAKNWCEKQPYNISYHFLTEKFFGGV